MNGIQQFGINILLPHVVAGTSSCSCVIVQARVTAHKISNNCLVQLIHLCKMKLKNGSRINERLSFLTFCICLNKLYSEHQQQWDYKLAFVGF